MSSVSPNTPIGQAGSPQRHIRFSHRTIVIRPRQAHRAASGAGGLAGRNHFAPRAAGFDLIRLHRHDQAAVTNIPNVEHVHTDNIQRTHRLGRTSGNRTTHEWVTVGSFAEQELGRL